MVRLFKEHGELLGYRRMQAYLRMAGFLLNHKTVLKLMRELGLKTKVLFTATLSFEKG
ncbi:MAG: IS3 family transposase [Bradymonadia bacterium]